MTRLCVCVRTVVAAAPRRHMLKTDKAGVQRHVRVERHASERSEACLMHATGTLRTHRTHRTRLTAGDSGRRIAASAGTTTYLCLLQCTYRDARAALPSPLLGCCNAQKVVFHSRCPSCHTPSLKVERFPSGAVVSLRLSRSRLLSSLEVERCRWSGSRRAAPRAGRLRSRRRRRAAGVRSREEPAKHARRAATTSRVAHTGTRQISNVKC